jgi:prepilin-type processing-associated H-X9-DG protein
MWLYFCYFRERIDLHYTSIGAAHMMSQKSHPIFIGDTVQHLSERNVRGEFVDMLGETFYKIQNYDQLEPFFMSIVSSSNHWLFISSTGGLSAGRVSAEQALFPYYTDDKLTESNENTGHKSILLVTRSERRSLWEPFSERSRGNYHIERNIYKNVLGTVLLFEEHNFSLGLTYRYAWRTSDLFGFVKTAGLLNSSDSACQVEFVDGIQNILPANITSLTQNTFSPLLDAYKRSEVDRETGLAIFALNSTLTDLAEPSESLLATTVMQLGVDNADYLLSSRQLENFRSGMDVEMETEVRGRRCAYFVHATLELAAGTEKAWHLVADVNQDSAAIVSLKHKLNEDRLGLAGNLEEDIACNHSNLERIVANADGLQISNDPLCTAHHFANVMFNVMRGGFFSNGYNIHTQDFIEFVSVRNRSILVENKTFFAQLPSEMNVLDLHARAEATGQADLIRLSYGYLPLTFSRRHGDPSRPWNRFAIDIKKPDGSLKLGYEGNWRDIFQNWEALAYSYPEYIESMICTFLNATTADGYNPYRITREGIDWELPEPHNPWANIGYWSDHQIIYLQKLMEINEKVHPGKLQSFLSRSIFSIANVPYRIKPYAELQDNPFNTIDFNWELEREINRQVQERGRDGRLVQVSNGKVLHITLAEKLLTLLLAKFVNFVPEGGIWMNTQRPEWNDANNALVGKGLSVVTLCYLRRTIVFYKALLQRSGLPSAQVSMEMQKLFSQIFKILQEFQGTLTGTFSAEGRRAMMDALGQAGSDYRWKYYSQGLSGEYTRLLIPDMVVFLDLAGKYVEHSLRANKRSDNLYHAYNILQLDKKSASISHLYEMLEGQVAILSSGMLSSADSLSLLESLRNSKLYRPDQHSYILYPDRDLPGFLEKNSMTSDQVSGLKLISELVKANDKTLIVRDEEGNYHFSGHIRNLKDVMHALDSLKNQYSEFVANEAEKIKLLFENIFHHSEFTGRSGTFFAYEGLGSIYWHMVSKLLLAVQETILRARGESSIPALIARYTDIRKGLSFNKSPEVYGAFPTDPYSHTPKGQGAKQPGMTGMVKEEILTRQMELGFSVENGCIVFDFLLLNRNEFLAELTEFAYQTAQGQQEQIELVSDSLAYTICQVPVILRASEEPGINVHFSDGNILYVDGHVLDPVNSRHIFQRDGLIHHLVVSVTSIK